MNNCKFCNKEWISNRSRIQHELRCGNNPNKKDIWNKGLTESDLRVRKSTDVLKALGGKQSIGRKMTIEQKKHLSEIRIKYLKENPDKVPYVLNHYSKGPSYPEQYFGNIFSKLNFINEYRIGLYSLDFADIVNKIDIEIDGEQHYLDKRIIESDIKRTIFLENIGWTIKRIRWSEYQKLTFENKQKFIKEIIKDTL